MSCPRVSSFQHIHMHAKLNLTPTERRPIFLSSYAVTDLSLVESLCQNIYFPVSSTSIGQITSMHGIFFFLLKEYQALKDSLCEKFDFKVHLAQCEKNFSMGLETFDIMVIPSFDNILGLTMGVCWPYNHHKPQKTCS